MENGTLVAAHDYVEGNTFRLRLGAVIAGLALIFTMVVLVQSGAEASPSAGSTSVTASVASIDVGAAQIDFSQIFCAILLTIRNAFASSPFFAFIVAAIDPLLAAFGCVPSPG